MKFLFVLLAVCAFSYTALAQDSWKVILNGKTVLSTKQEDTGKNTIILSAADLKKKNDFIVLYTQNEKQESWERSITAYTSNDAELTSQKGKRFKIKNGTLQSLFKKSGTIMLYTWSLPIDPELKATVRVRRVHLCTLVLK